MQVIIRVASRLFHLSDSMSTATWWWYTYSFSFGENEAAAQLFLLVSYWIWHVTFLFTCPPPLSFETTEGQAWWLTLWKAKTDRSLELRIWRPVWATWWNPISAKNTKISHAWWCMLAVPAEVGRWSGRITWAQEAEVAVSREHATALQPGQQSETLSQV